MIFAKCQELKNKSIIKKQRRNISISASFIIFIVGSIIFASSVTKSRCSKGHRYNVKNHSNSSFEANENGSKIGIVIELKYSKTEKGLDKDCCEALQQIDDKNYMQELQRKGCQKILKYGIAFYHKKCRVLAERN